MKKLLRFVWLMAILLLDIIWCIGFIPKVIGGNTEAVLGLFFALSVMVITAKELKW